MFTHEDTWKGGSYELAIELGERDDDRLGAALKALWQHPSLEGCYLQMEAEPEDQARAFSKFSAPARSPSRPPISYDSVVGREGERAGADTAKAENALGGRAPRAGPGVAITPEA